MNATGTDGDGQTAAAVDALDELEDRDLRSLPGSGDVTVGGNVDAAAVVVREQYRAHAPDGTDEFHYPVASLRVTLGPLSASVELLPGEIDELVAALIRARDRPILDADRRALEDSTDE